MGKATERLFLPIMQMVLPEIVDINMPAEGVFHNLVIVSIQEGVPGPGTEGDVRSVGPGPDDAGQGDCGGGRLRQRAGRLGGGLASDQQPDASRDIIFASGPVDDLDHASPTARFGSKVGIDATAKGPLEGRQREWPPDIVMSDEIKALVDSKWAE